MVMAGGTVFYTEKVSGIRLPWNRRTIFLGSLGVLLLLSIWMMRAHSEQPLGLGGFKIPWTTSHAASSEASSQPVQAALSGDVENDEFPDAVGFNGNLALIMEENPAAVPNFVPVVTHFRNMLGTSWEMVILTRRGWRIPESFLFRNLLSSGAIKVRFLPEEFDHFPTHASVSIFLTSPWLWETFQNVNRVFMFQPDSILCSKSSSRVDDFVEWDFIGAPIKPIYLESLTGDETHEANPDARGYNGGLCIRNPRVFRDIARKYNFTADLYSGPPEDKLPNFLRFEDHWFMRKLEDTPEIMSKAKLPPPEVAGAFSVETWYWDRPMGYHQPHRWQPERYDEIVEWCPEVGMIYNMEAPDQRWGKREIVQ